MCSTGYSTAWNHCIVSVYISQASYYWLLGRKSKVGHADAGQASLFAWPMYKLLVLQWIFFHI